MDERQARYADLIECSARILAFDGLIDAALPVLASALTSRLSICATVGRIFSAMTRPERLTCPSSMPSLRRCSPVPMLCGEKFSVIWVVPRRQKTWPRECANIWQTCENIILRKPQGGTTLTDRFPASHFRKSGIARLGAVRRHRRTAVPAGAVAYGRRQAGPSAAFRRQRAAGHIAVRDPIRSGSLTLRETQPSGLAVCGGVAADLSAIGEPVVELS